MQMLSLFLALSTVAAESTPGTETILLVRGGYGPGVNLFSSGSQTHRHRGHRQAPAAPVDRTASEKNELEKLNNVSQTAQMLNSQLQTAIKTTYAALQESEQVRVDDANLKEKLSVDERKIQQGADAEKARAQLEAEVKSLQALLVAEKSKTAAEHARAAAIQAKAASLENDIKVISRSWKAAAQHQANLAKEAQAELKAKAPVVAKKAPSAVSKAQVQKKSVKKAPVVAKKAPSTVSKAQVQKKSVKKVVKQAAVKKVVDEDEDSDDDSDDSQDDDDDSKANTADDDSTEDN